GSDVPRASERIGKVGDWRADLILETSPSIVELTSRRGNRLLSEIRMRPRVASDVEAERVHLAHVVPLHHHRGPSLGGVPRKLLLRSDVAGGDVERRRQPEVRQDRNRELEVVEVAVVEGD